MKCNAAGVLHVASVVGVLFQDVVAVGFKIFLFFLLNSFGS